MHDPKVNPKPHSCLKNNKIKCNLSFIFLCACVYVCVYVCVEFLNKKVSKKIIIIKTNYLCKKIAHDTPKI